MSLLTNKTVLITGASRGIGRSIAIACLQNGANIAFTYSKSAGAADELVNELHKYKPTNHIKVKAYQADASSFSEAKIVVEKILNEFGAIDALINNAGITRDKIILRLTESDWDEVINTNLKSVFNYSRHVTPVMIRAQKGSIINLSSIVGIQGNAGQTNYAASKAGIIGFSKSLAKEVGSRGIRVNVIAPGFIKTDMTGKLDEQTIQDWEKEIPLKRVGNPEDIAHVAVFLASDMSSYITGQTLSVCGGLNI